ncbi:hypothetical protein PO909_028444, partial [Leuciscus waleckii]
NTSAQISPLPSPNHSDPTTDTATPQFSCLQRTLAALISQHASHTVPHSLRNRSSTLPEQKSELLTSLRSV